MSRVDAIHLRRTMTSSRRRAFMPPHLLNPPPRVSSVPLAASAAVAWMRLTDEAFDGNSCFLRRRRRQISDGDLMLAAAAT